MFIGGVYASTSSMVQAIIGVWLLNWPHTQNVTITNWPKLPASNTTIVTQNANPNRLVTVFDGVINSSQAPWSSSTLVELPVVNITQYSTIHIALRSPTLTVTLTVAMVYFTGIQPQGVRVQLSSNAYANGIAYYTLTSGTCPSGACANGPAAPYADSYLQVQSGVGRVTVQLLLQHWRSFLFFFFPRYDSFALVSEQILDACSSR